MNKDLVLVLLCRCCACLAALVPLTSAMADPLLPYAQPIALQLSNDIASLDANPSRTPSEAQQLRNDKLALAAYQRPSETLSTDISALRHIYSYVGPNPGYFAPISDAIAAYIDDFQSREESLRLQALGTPRSRSKTNTLARLHSVSNVLARAEADSNQGRQLTDLQTAARRLIAASNGVARAQAVPFKNSSITARIARIPFASVPKGTEGSLSNGVLTIMARDGGEIKRTIELVVNGILDVPATYSLAIPGNSATYTAVDSRHHVYMFSSVNVSNSIPSVLTVDSISEKGIIGHFQFHAEIQTPAAPYDTNTFTTITNGEFQLKLP